MVQLNILSGRQAGTQWEARRFPFHIGRDAQAALVLDDQGVWERHAEFALRPGEGILLSARTDALVTINGQKTSQAILRNGDLIEAGAVKLRFSLSPTQHGSLRLRETLTWVGIAALTLGQVTLIYWMLT